MASFQLSISLSEKTKPRFIHSGDAYYCEENNDGLVIGVFQNKKKQHLLKSILQNSTAFINNLEMGFSFVYWNKITDEIHLFRDLFGIKPLYFSIVNSTLYCSTTLAYLAEKNCNKINKDTVTSFFEPTFDDEPIDSITFFSNVFRVLPGHKCIIGTNSFEQYKAIDLSLSSKDNFSELLKNSIHEITESYEKLGSHLSGGLDSSSIVGLLQNNDIEAYYFDTGQGSNDEKNLAVSFANTLKNCNLNILKYLNNQVDQAKECCKLTYLPELLVLPLETFDIISKSASETQIKAIFSGHGGDTIVGYGWDYLDELFELGKFQLLEKELIKYFDLNKDNPQVSNNYPFKFTKENFCNYFIIKQLKKTYNKQRIKNLSNIYLKAHSPLSFRISTSLKIALIFFSIKLKTTFSFTKETKAGNSLKTHKEKFSNILTPTANRFQKNQVDAHYVRLGIHALEVFDMVHAKYSQEAVYPFLTKKLLECSLNTPLVTKFYNGHGRGLLRQSMKNIVPDYILLRNTKEDFNNAFYNYFNNINEQYTIKTDSPVWRLTKKKSFDLSLSILLNSNFTQKHKTHHLWYCLKVLSVAIWLETLELEV